MEQVYEFYIYRGTLKRKLHEKPSEEILEEIRHPHNISSLQSRVFSTDPDGSYASCQFSRVLTEKAEDLDEKAGIIQEFINNPSFTDAEVRNLAAYAQARRKKASKRKTDSNGDVSFVVSYAWKGPGIVTKSKIYYLNSNPEETVHPACTKDGQIEPWCENFIVDTTYVSKSETDIRIAYAVPAEDDQAATTYFVRHANRILKSLKEEAVKLREKADFIKNLKPVDQLPYSLAPSAGI